MRTATILLAMLVARVAAAQPGMVPPAYAYQPPLTAEDRELLATGEIPNVAGAMVADGLIGFGIGQAIEHRWSETGWIFTFGETIATGVFLDGFVSSICIGGGPNARSHCDTGNAGSLALGGAIALTVLRVTGFLDTAIGPMRHNNKLRALRARLAPAPDGFALRF